MKDISQTLAQTIVTDMSNIINQHINFIDTTGYIIASTDFDRIGKYHEAGKNVIETRKDHVINHDHQYEGALKGINMPIYLNQNIVGVIGITGNKNEIKQYGKIIKRMTEILVKEAFMADLSNQERKDHQKIIEKLLFDKENLTLTSELNTKIPCLSDFKTVIVGKIDVPYSESEIAENILQGWFDKRGQESEFLVGYVANYIVMLSPLTSRNKLEILLNKMQKKIYQLYGGHIKFGVSSNEEEEASNLHIVYERAIKSVRSLNLDINTEVKFYEDIGLEMLLIDVHRELKNNFVDSIFSELNTEEREETLIIINLFGELEGSINRIAENLYIHKNTLQYKLNKIKQKTGYDLRKHQDFTLLKIASMLQYDKNS